MGPAQIINTGSQEGIQGHFTALGHDPHHYTIFYVQVDDISAQLAKAEQLGGKVVVPKVDIPSYGSFAWFGDPDGNVIGLWKPVIFAALFMACSDLPAPAEYAVGSRRKLANRAFPETGTLNISRDGADFKRLPCP